MMSNVTRAIGVGAIVGLMLGALLWSPAVWAALGEPEASVQADGAQLKGELQPTEDRGSYRVSEIRAPSGTVVREYSNPAGTVFAITWRGPSLPNLKQMLGAYYERYANAVPGSPHNRHQLTVHTDDLTVRMSGHMRAFVGRAYLASAVPAGVAVAELP